MSNPTSSDVEVPEDLGSLETAALYIQRVAFTKLWSILQDVSANSILTEYADQEHQMSSQARTLDFWRYQASVQISELHAARHYQLKSIPRFFDLLRCYATSRRDPVISARLKAKLLVSIAKRSLRTRATSRTTKPTFSFAKRLESDQSTSAEAVRPRSSPALTHKRTPVAASKPEAESNEVKEMRKMLAQANDSIKVMQDQLEQQRLAQERVVNDQMAQDVNQALGPGSASPPKAPPDSQAQKAQEELNHHQEIIAEARAQSITRHALEKKSWDEAMFERMRPQHSVAPPSNTSALAASCLPGAPAPAIVVPAQNNAAPSPVDEQVSDLCAQQLLEAAKSNSAYQQQARSVHTVASEAPTVVGPGLQHIIDSVPTPGQSSEMQLVLQQLAEMRNEMSMLKNSAVKQAPDQPRMDALGQQELIMVQVDKECPTVNAEDYSLPQDYLTTCLRPGCNITQIPGAPSCVCAAPRNSLDFRCPDAACGKMIDAGTFEVMLKQKECRHCFCLLPWATDDPYLRAKNRAKPSTVVPAFDSEPPQELSTVFQKRHKITQAQDTAALLIRRGNSAGNYIAAAGAASVKKILQSLKQGARSAAKNMALGIKIHSMHNAKVVLAIFKLAVGKHKDDKSPSWHLEFNEVVSRAASHGDSSMEWTTSILDAPAPKFDHSAPNAIVIVHQHWQGITEYVCVLLSDTFAAEHHRMSERLIKCHYVEAEELDGKHIDFSVLQIIQIYHEHWARYADMMHSHVTKSEFMHQHFGQDLLWSHAGTAAQRPMFILRWLKGGRPIWAPYVERTFFISARIAFCANMQAVALEADEPTQVPKKRTPGDTGSTDGAPTQDDKISDLQKQIAELKRKNKQTQSGAPAEDTPAEASSDTQEPYQEFWEKNKSIDPMVSSALFPNADGVWAEIVIPNLCPKCITANCSGECEQHNWAPISGGDGRMIWRYEVIAAVAKKEPADRLAAYKTAAKKYYKSFRGRNSRKAAKARQLMKDDPAYVGSNESEERVELTAFTSGAAIGDEVMQQPAMSHYRATLCVGDKTKSNQPFRLPDCERDTNLTRAVQMGVPELAKNAIITVTGTAHCVGMDVDTPYGIQQHRCGFVATAGQVHDLPGKELFTEVLESSIIFLDAVDDLEEKYAHLAAAEVIEVYLMHGIAVHDAVFNRHLPTSYFWLRTAFPKCLRRQPVLVAYMHEGLVCFQLYICAASLNNMSQLDSKVIHVLAHEVHSYIMQWDCDLSTLDKVLHFLGKIHRFADVGINLCNSIENTVNAVLPSAPSYLDGAEMLISVLDAELGQKVTAGTDVINLCHSSSLNLCHRLRGSDNSPASSVTELSQQLTAALDKVKSSNAQSKLGGVTERHSHLNTSNATVAVIEQPDQLLHAIKSRSLRSNRDPEHRCEVMTVVVPISNTSAALVMVDEKSLIDDIICMLDEQGAILTTQWSLLLNGKRLDHRTTVAAAHISDLSTLNLQHVHAGTELSGDQGHSDTFTAHSSGPHAFGLAVQINLNRIVSTTCMNQADMPANDSMFGTRTCFDSVQVISNVKAQLAKELVICNTLGQNWQASNAHLFSMLADLQSILRVQLPIHSACRQLAKIRSTSTDGYTRLRYLKWVTSRVAIIWARHLTSDFCCTLRPSYAFLSRQTEQTAYQLTVSPEGITLVDLPGMYSIAVRGDAKVAEMWLRLANMRSDEQLHSWLLEAIRPHIQRPGRMRSFVLALRLAWNSQQEQDWMSVKSRAMRAGLIPPPKSPKIMSSGHASDAAQAIDLDPEAAGSPLQSQPLAASPDWSPIAAHQVNQALHPLEQYQQALKRHNQGSESHAAWRTRVVARHDDLELYCGTGNNRSADLARACVSRAIVRYVPGVSNCYESDPESPCDDYSDSSESEAAPGLQLALMPAVPLHRKPAQQLAEFHNSLPEELRLPTAAQIAKARAEKTRQTTLDFKVQNFRPGR